MLEGERSGRIVKRGARSLLNLPNTVSPFPSAFKPAAPFLLPLLLLLRENLDGFVLRAAKLLSLSMLLRVFVHTYSIRDPFVHRAQYVT